MGNRGDGIDSSATNMGHQGRDQVQAGDIRSAVLATLASIAPETDLTQLKPDLPLRHQDDLDSGDWINVIVELCDRLSIDIPESDMGRLATLDSIVAYASTRREEGQRAPLGAGRTGLPCSEHLINGVRVTVRPMRPDDAALETGFVQHLSKESRYDRFMVTLRELPQAKLRFLTEVDQVRHVALVATIDRDGREVMVGAVRYAVDAAGTGCEFAIAIDDAWQGSGLAGILMRTLMDTARSRGIRTMEGEVLAINSRMLRFTRQLGFRQERDPNDRDTVRVVRSL
jgi:acetyltransferase